MEDVALSEKNDPMKRNPISEREKEVLTQLPATFVDKTYVTMSASGARITFAETGVENGFPSMRASFFMPLPALLALRDLLVRTCSNIEVVELPDQEESGARKEET